MNARRLFFFVAVAVVAVVAGSTAFAQSNEHRPSQPIAFSTGARGTFDERDGEMLYRSICQGCHMVDARGATGAGTYPALAGNVRLASPEYFAITVLNGRRNMPSFAPVLDDAQVAAVVGYVRTHFGNAYAAPVTAEQVAALRTPR